MKGGRGSANMVIKCKICARENSLGMLTPPPTHHHTHSVMVVKGRARAQYFIWPCWHYNQELTDIATAFIERPYLPSTPLLFVITVKMDTVNFGA